MIDVVYALGPGSPWKDNELKYSLRSLDKYFMNLRNVFIIGHKPDFLSDKVLHIPYKDIYSNKARNIMSKIHWICSDKRCSSDFIFLNDDYFFLKPFSAENYPYYYKCSLSESVLINQNEYGKHCEATRKTLLEAGLDTKNFDVHLPISYNKSLFKRMCSEFNWNVPYGYIAKSMYCNYTREKGIMREDVKISHPYNIPQIHHLNNAREMFSIADRALNRQMKEYLEQLFPNKSSFEV